MRSGFLSIVSLALALSLAANVFLLRFRNQSPVQPGPAAVQQTGQKGDALGPQAFGDLAVALFLPAPKDAKAAKYSLGAVQLPALPSALPIYRDQGMTAFTSGLDTLLRSLGAPVDWDAVRPTPFMTDFVSSDGLWSIVFDAPSRTIGFQSTTVAPTGTAKALPGTDETVAIASGMLTQLGISIPAGTPVVQAQRAPKQGMKLVTTSGKSVLESATAVPDSLDVLWPLQFDGKPVIDLSGRPVGAIEVTVDTRVKAVTAVSLRLLDPARLSTSDYPAAASDIIRSAALSGGLLPLPKAPGTTKDPGPVIEYSAAEVVYVLSDPTENTPASLVPFVRLTADLPAACDSCGATQWRALVPAVEQVSLKR